MSRAANAPDCAAVPTVYLSLLPAPASLYCLRVLTHCQSPSPAANMEAPRQAVSSGSYEQQKVQPVPKQAFHDRQDSSSCMQSSHHNKPCG